MTRIEVLNGMRTYMNLFKELPIYVQKENQELLGFLQCQYRTIKLSNEVGRYSRYASPMLLFKFNKEDDFNSIQLYFDTMGVSIDNILEFKPISLLDSKKNIYIQIKL